MSTPQDKSIFGCKRQDGAVHLTVDGRVYRLSDRTAKTLAARLVVASNPDADTAHRVGGAIWKMLESFRELSEK